MLCLSRKVDEVIVITPPGCAPIYVSINGIHGSVVRVGVGADSDVRINRLEVEQKIERERSEAA